MYPFFLELSSTEENFDNQKKSITSQINSSVEEKRFTIQVRFINLLREE